MASLLTTVGSVVTAAVGWVGDFAGAITASGNEILLIPICLTVAGFGVGILRRLMNVQ